MHALVALLALSQGNIDFGESWNKAASAIRRMYYARESRKDEMERLLTAYEAKAKAATTKVCPLGKLEPQYQAVSHNSGRALATTVLST